MNEINGVKLLSCAEVEARRATGTEHILLDVRTAEEWGERHIPGALHVPMQALTSKYQEQDASKEVICMCEHGIRSLHAATFLLTQCGFTDVASMEGGMSEWTGEVESSFA